MKIAVCISKKNNFSKIIHLFLAQKFEKVYFFERLSESIEGLKLVSPDVIFLSSTLILDEDKSILKDLLVQNIKAGRIVFGNNKALKTALPDYYFSELESIQVVEDKLKIMLGIDHPEVYIPVSIDFIDENEIIDYDLYLKISSNFIRVYDSEEQDPELYQKYKNKNVKFFYLNEKDYKRFIHANKFCQTSYDNKSPTEIIGDSVEYAKEVLKNINLEIEIPCNVTSTIDRLVEEYKRDEKQICENLEKSLFNPQTSYSLKLNSLTIILMYLIIDNVKWANREDFRTLIYACLLQNTFINDRPDLLKIYKESQVEGLNKEDQEIVQSHAYYSYKKSLLLKNIEPEVKTILLQQNGSFTGYGIHNIPVGTKLSQTLKLSGDMAIIILEFYESQSDDLNILLDRLKSDLADKGEEFSEFYSIVMNKFLL